MCKVINSVVQTNTELNYLDVISFSGYKFVAIISALVVGIFTKSYTLFLAVIIYGIVALCYFLVRSLKVRVQSRASPAHGQYQLLDNKRKGELLFPPGYLSLFW